MTIIKYKYNNKHISLHGFYEMHIAWIIEDAKVKFYC